MNRQQRRAMRARKYRVEGDYTVAGPCLECEGVVLETESVQIPDGMLCFNCLDGLEKCGGVSDWLGRLESQRGGHPFFAETAVEGSDPTGEDLERVHRAINLSLLSKAIKAGHVN